MFDRLRQFLSLILRLILCLINRNSKGPQVTCNACDLPSMNKSPLHRSCSLSWRETCNTCKVMRMMHQVFYNNLVSFLCHKQRIRRLTAQATDPPSEQRNNNRISQCSEASCSKRERKSTMDLGIKSRRNRLLISCTSLRAHHHFSNQLSNQKLTSVQPLQWVLIS